MSELIRKIWWRFILIGGTVTVLLFFSFVVTLTYWFFFPSVPLIVYSDVFPVTNPGHKVCAGFDMTYLVDFDKRLPVQCRISRQLIDSGSPAKDYPVGYPPIKKPGRMTEEYTLYVPKDTELRKWHMRWTANCEGGNIFDTPVPISRISEEVEVVDCGYGIRRGPKGEQGI